MKNLLTLNNSGLFRTSAMIAGQWLDAEDDSHFVVTNPADGSLLAEVADLGSTETQQAIDAAQAAWPKWKALSAKERSAILRRWFELILENQEDLARIMTGEQGKPLAESRGEIAYGASFVEWFAEEAKRIYGDVIPAPINDRRFVVIKQPVGVWQR